MTTTIKPKAKRAKQPKVIKEFEYVVEDHEDRVLITILKPNTKAGKAFADTINWDEEIDYETTLPFHMHTLNEQLAEHTNEPKQAKATA